MRFQRMKEGLKECPYLKGKMWSQGIMDWEVTRRNINPKV